MKNTKVLTIALYISLITHNSYCQEHSQMGWPSHAKKCITNFIWRPPYSQEIEEIVPKIIDGTSPKPLSAIALNVFFVWPFLPGLIAAPMIPFDYKRLYQSGHLPFFTFVSAWSIVGFTYLTYYDGWCSFKDMQLNEQAAIGFYRKRLNNRLNPTINEKIAALNNIKSTINKEHYTVRISVANNAIDTLIADYTNNYPKVSAITQEIKTQLSNKKLSQKEATNIINNFQSKKACNLMGVNLDVHSSIDYTSTLSFSAEKE